MLKKHNDVNNIYTIYIQLRVASSNSLWIEAQGERIICLLHGPNYNKLLFLQFYIDMPFNTTLLSHFVSLTTFIVMPFNTMI